MPKTIKNIFDEILEESYRLRNYGQQVFLRDYDKGLIELIGIHKSDKYFPKLRQLPLRVLQELLNSSPRTKMFTAYSIPHYDGKQCRMIKSQKTGSITILYYDMLVCKFLHYLIPIGLCWSVYKTVRDNTIIFDGFGSDNESLNLLIPNYCADGGSELKLLTKEDQDMKILNKLIASGLLRGGKKPDSESNWWNDINTMDIWLETTLSFSSFFASGNPTNLKLEKWGEIPTLRKTILCSECDFYDLEPKQHDDNLYITTEQLGNFNLSRKRPKFRRRSAFDKASNILQSLLSILQQDKVQRIRLSILKQLLPKEVFSKISKIVKIFDPETVPESKDFQDEEVPPLEFISGNFSNYLKMLAVDKKTGKEQLKKDGNRGMDYYEGYEGQGYVQNLQYIIRHILETIFVYSGIVSSPFMMVPSFIIGRRKYIDGTRVSVSLENGDNILRIYQLLEVYIQTSDPDERLHVCVGNCFLKCRINTAISPEIIEIGSDNKFVHDCLNYVVKYNDYNFLSNSRVYTKRHAQELLIAGSLLRGEKLNSNRREIWDGVSNIAGQLLQNQFNDLQAISFGENRYALSGRFNIRLLFLHRGFGFNQLNGADEILVEELMYVFAGSRYRTNYFPLAKQRYLQLESLYKIIRHDGLGYLPKPMVDLFSSKYIPEDISSFDDLCQRLFRMLDPEQHKKAFERIASKIEYPDGYHGEGYFYGMAIFPALVVEFFLQKFAQSRDVSHFCVKTADNCYGFDGNKIGLIKYDSSDSIAFSFKCLINLSFNDYYIAIGICTVDFTFKNDLIKIEKMTSDNFYLHLIFKNYIHKMERFRFNLEPLIACSLVRGYTKDEREKLLSSANAVARSCLDNSVFPDIIEDDTNSLFYFRTKLLLRHVDYYDPYCLDPHNEISKIPVKHIPLTDRDMYKKLFGERLLYKEHGHFSKNKKETLKKLNTLRKLVGIDHLATIPTSLFSFALHGEYREIFLNRSEDPSDLTPIRKSMRDIAKFGKPYSNIVESRQIVPVSQQHEEEKFLSPPSTPKRKKFSEDSFRTPPRVKRRRDHQTPPRVKRWRDYQTSPRGKPWHDVRTPPQARLQHGPQKIKIVASPEYKDTRES